MLANPAVSAMKTRLAAFAGVGLTVLADQASKYWVLNVSDLPLGERLTVAPGLELVLTWNRGISYGLFQQDSALGRWLLVGFTVVATLALVTWMVRASHRLTIFGLSLIVGGAIGNFIDRVAYGAVVDFVYFHILSFSWYVFNLADCAIVAGVAALLYDSFGKSHSDAAKSG
ncbi:signal peptidase II [Oryzibacter oryziterrae]|uniref:signal peptidase II n=1 Tax=Oryzibacter oryziterrae TaxID=2766474 RepID=UPI001F0092FD|nr:signal peptidase II [Oryzibacter oryziterrae]